MCQSFKYIAFLYRFVKHKSSTRSIVNLTKQFKANINLAKWNNESFLICFTDYLGFFLSLSLNNNFFLFKFCWIFYKQFLNSKQIWLKRFYLHLVAMRLLYQCQSILFYSFVKFTADGMNYTKYQIKQTSNRKIFF